MLQLHAGGLLKRPGDVAGGDGAEQLALLAHAHLDGDSGALHLGHQIGAGLFVQPGLAAGLLLGAGLSDGDVVFGGRGGQPAGKQVVAGEAVGDVLDIAHAGGAFDLLHEDYFHATLLTGLPPEAYSRGASASRGDQPPAEMIEGGPLAGARGLSTTFIDISSTEAF